ncbi:MAG TPA: DUF535 family protein [Bacteroidales bacterium]
MRIPFLSVAMNGWQRASKAFSHERKSYLIWQQWRSFFAALIYYKVALKWFGIIESPGFTQISVYRPKLYFKPFRVYMSIRWNAKQRIKVMLDTYRFILSKGDAFARGILQTGGIVIASIMLGDAMDGVLTLGYDERFRKEGELVLSFDCNQLGGRIVSAAFSFEEIETGCWVCRIGCIQGHMINESNSSKAVQKLMHGLRPKSFIVFAVQELTRQLGFNAIYGAGDGIQAYRRKHFIHLSRRHAIQFNYNSLWAESGGQPYKDGWFELPLTPLRKNMQEIKSNKRSLYLKRFSVLDDLSAQIADSCNKISG